MAVFNDIPVREDGVAVARLKAAGAVILGKTNTPVALADWQSVNPIHGRTVNPHDHARSPGGSSGGAAAALAAGMVPLEIGSDIGGSIRVPALDANPLAATDTVIRNALNWLADALVRAGAKVMHRADDLPDLAAAHRSYATMLTAVTTRGVPGAKPIDAHAWMELMDEQMRLTRRWRAVYAEVDVVLTPAFGAPAFPHEDNPDWSARRLTIDREATPYGAQLAWPGLATFPSLPATCVPIAKSDQRLPIGVQIIGGMFEDRTTLAFAGPLEREGLLG